MPEPTLKLRNIETSVRDALLGLRTSLLPEDIRADQLVVWVWDDRLDAKLRAISSAEGLPFSEPLRAAFGHVSQHSLLFYRQTLIHIGRQWKVSHLATLNLNAASDPENFAESIRQTRDKLTPAVGYGLDEAALEQVPQALERILSHGKEYHAGQIAQAKKWWEQWREEVKVFSDTLDSLSSLEARNTEAVTNYLKSLFSRASRTSALQESLEYSGIHFSPEPFGGRQFTLAFVALVDREHRERISSSGQQDSRRYYSKQKFTLIAGSERQPVRGARLIHNSHPDQIIEVSIRLRPKSEAKHIELRSALEKPGFKHLSRAEYENAHGSDPADLSHIKRFVQEFGLTIIETGTELARRTVTLSGTVSAFEKAFHVELKEYSHPRGNFRGRTGTISVPTEYSGIITGVFGLDNRPQVEPHFRRLQQPPGSKAHAAITSRDPNEISQLYDYPPGDGAGQCIGIIEFGGGFQLNDLSSYFGSLNLTVPQVIFVSVDGGKNGPSDLDSADGEVTLDIEVAGAIAPAAKIVVYFAPNTDRGFLDAITAAVHDGTNQPSVISISWGSAELQWTGQALINIDDALQAAAAIGVTVCVASGDNGSSDGLRDGNNHVDFPASSPFALGCGGTTLQANGQIINETVWNAQPNGGAGGGGISNVFPLPAWQDGFSVPSPTVQGGGRGVPDVAGNADPNTGYNVLVGGKCAIFGGTSAVAPLWAALVARMNQQIGQQIGFLNPLIYSQAVEASGFRDVTFGNNGAFSATAGWDACTGLGSPDGAKLLAALTGAPMAHTTARGRSGRSKESAA